MRIRCCFQRHKLLMPAVRICGTAASFVISFFKTVIVCEFSSGRVHIPLFWADPSLFGTFNFLFEEFVNVFPSFSWSPDHSVGVASCAQFRVPISRLCGLVKWRFSVAVSISFFCESCSSIEFLRCPSFRWLLQCFSLCVQCSLLLFRSMWHQFLHQHRLQMKHHCARLDELLCSVRHRFHHQCHTCFIDVNFFNIFVDPDFLFLDLFASLFCLNDESSTSCVASIESFFRVLCWESMFLLRDMLSEILRRRTTVNDD